MYHIHFNVILTEANWGSSTQAQQFVTALKNVQSLNDVPEHVKNYRPKLLVFSGVPAHRQPLVDFGYLITKKLSLMICSHIETVGVNRMAINSSP
jgi:solute carrier family 12 sodium/potassium/chloride transporter 2